MGILGKIFGKKATEVAPAQSLGNAPEEGMIKVFDAYGRDLYITREQWRTAVLPGSLKDAWNSADKLYSMVVSALQDGFRSDVIDAAERLYKIDVTSRGACVWGIVLMEEGRLDEAEQILRSSLLRHGEDGVILTNLAKVCAARKNETMADEILWRALQVDPNQDNGLLWYVARHQDRGGSVASDQALRRLAALPRSWRAQLWLARNALQAGQLGEALSHYHESLSRAGDPAPYDLLQQMSGDLGQHGHLRELVELTEPKFDVHVHGLHVGNNLIKAYVDLGQLEMAHRLVELHHSEKRPDWGQTLLFWEGEITKSRIASHELEKPLKLTMLTISGPVWLHPSFGSSVFASKPQDEILVCILGSTAQMASSDQAIRQQPTDNPGRMSRALPLFLAERIHFASHAKVQTLVPWILGNSPGFVLGGVPWTDQDAATYAKQVSGDYVVVTYLRVQTEPWQVELRLIRTRDGACLATLTTSFSLTQGAMELMSFSDKMLDALTKHTEVKNQTIPRHYVVPQQGEFSNYLLRLEQLLAVRCSAMEGNDGFLTKEREILLGNIQLCLTHPENVPTRFMLFNTAAAMKRTHPQAVAEYRDRLLRLHNEQPLTPHAQSAVQRLIDEQLLV